MITAIKQPNFNVAEPAISENALRVHYEQHYLKYIKNAQELIKEFPWKGIPTTDIIKISDPKYGLHNNVAQVYNHEFFFEQFTTNPTKLMDCLRLLDTLEFSYGPLGNIEYYFKQDIIERCASAFGSGYLWVWHDEKDFELQIKVLPNAETPLKYLSKITPLLCIDLWEHSYYLDYQSDRATYVKNVLDAIDWKVIEERLP